jgi:hypothetical protein
MARLQEDYETILTNLEVHASGLRGHSLADVLNRAADVLKRLEHAVYATAPTERDERARQHRLRALEPLSEKLAKAVFAYVETAPSRVMLQADLAAALHSALLRSGLVGR